MDAKQRYRIELERISSRAKVLDNAVNNLKELQNKEKLSLSTIQFEIEKSRINLDQLNDEYRELDEIIDNTLKVYNDRVNQYNEHILILQKFIDDLGKTIEASNKILEENQNGVIRLKFQQQDIQNRIVEEEVRIANRKSDLDIYKRRLEKYIN